MAKSKKKSIKSKQRKKRNRKAKDMTREGNALPAPYDSEGQRFARRYREYPSSRVPEDRPRHIQVESDDSKPQQPKTLSEETSLSPL